MKPEKEKMITIVIMEMGADGEMAATGERVFKSVLYWPERHYEIEEKLAAIAGGASAHLFGALDEAGGASAARQLGGGSTAGINAGGLASAVDTLFKGLKSEGGFFKFAQLVLSDTKEIVGDKAMPLQIHTWRGDQVLIEDLTIQVLRHNFEAYFLARWQTIKGRLPAELIKSLEASPEGETSGEP